MSNLVRSVAPSNIALIKYWGKKDKVLKIPTFNSLSLTLNELRTETSICYSATNQFFLNGQELDFNDIQDFVSLFGCQENIRIDSYNNFPTAAGLASSASGYCALGLALNKFSNLNLGRQQLSTLIRQGSGSATRSLFGPISIWKSGNTSADSYSFLYPYSLNLKAIIMICDSHQKKVSSTKMMEMVQTNKEVYRHWLNMTQRHYWLMLDAIKNNNISLIGDIAIDNAHLMHNTVISLDSNLSYFNSKTMEVIQCVKFLRNKYKLFYTIDAGPNVVIFVDNNNFDMVESEIKELNIPYLISTLSNGGHVLD